MKRAVINQFQVGKRNVISSFKNLGFISRFKNLGLGLISRFKNHATGAGKFYDCLVNMRSPWLSKKTFDILHC